METLAGSLPGKINKENAQNVESHNKTIDFKFVTCDGSIYKSLFSVVVAVVVTGATVGIVIGIVYAAGGLTSADLHCTSMFLEYLTKIVTIHFKTS